MGSYLFLKKYIIIESMIPYNKKLIHNAKTLRKNMTKEERHIWYDFLKKLPFPVKRQHNIENYIVDFYIPQKKVVIEIDGLQHTDPHEKAKDDLRDEFLQKWGISVIRYSNKDVNTNFNSVVEDIMYKLGISVDDLNI